MTWRLRLWLVSWLLLLASPPARAAKPTWDLALVIDQSGSMVGNDPDGFALIAPAIFADMSNASDAVWIYPQSGGLFGGSVAPFQLVGNQRAAFKHQLEAVQSASSSEWEPAFEQAANRLSKGQGQRDRRLLVMVYDGDRTVSHSRSQALAAPILDAAGDGFVIGVGSDIGQRDRQPVMQMFGGEHALPVSPGDETALLSAFARAFAYLLDSKPAPVGTASPGKIQVTVAPQVSEAWLVALADKPVSSLTAAPGNPSATMVETQPETGWTHPTTNRSYQIAHLVGPQAGTWTFSADTGARQVSWLLLQTFAYGELSLSTEGPCSLGVPCTLVATPSGDPIPQDVTAAVTLPDGTTAVLHRGADGIYRGEAVFPSSGPQDAVLVAEGTHYRRESRELVEVQNAAGTLDCRSFQDQTGPAGAKLQVWLERQQTNIPLDEAWVEVPGSGRIELVPETPTRYAAVLTLPDQVGPVEVTATSTAAGVTNQCKAIMDLRPMVALASAPQPPVVVGPGSLASAANPFGPCVPADPEGELQRDPDSRCSACGACTGTHLPLDLTGSAIHPGEPIQGTLTLKSREPAGLGVYLGVGDPIESRLRQDAAVPFTLDPKRPTIPLAICAKSCPAKGSHTLEIEVAFDEVWDGTSGAGPTRVALTVPLQAEVTGSSLWTCWGWAIVSGTGIVLLVTFLYGFVHPLKFPTSRGRGSGQNFPYQCRTRALSNLDELHTNPQPLRKRARPARPWYRPNQKVYVTHDGSVGSDPKRAAVAIELRRVDGRLHAWFVPLGGQKFILAKYETGATAKDYYDNYVRNQDDDGPLEVGAEGHPLKLDHVYLPQNGKLSDWAMLFN